MQRSSREKIEERGVAAPFRLATTARESLMNRRSTRDVTAGLVLLFLGLAARVAAQESSPQRRMSLDDLAHLVGLSDPQIAPDGKSIAIVVSRPNYEDNRYDAELVLVDVESGRKRVLTHDRRGVGSPRWSPSGDRLGFLANATPRPRKGEKGGAHPARQLFVV